MKKAVFSFIISLNQFIYASDGNPRIQHLYLDQSKPQRIYLSPGLASSVQMPCEIAEVITPGAGISRHLSEANKARFSLIISKNAQSTNFIVHCIETTYVFDLIINKKLHNDYIEVVGDFGRPRITQFPYNSTMKVSRSDVKKAKPQLNTNLLNQLEKNRTAFDFNKIEKIKIISSSEVEHE